MKIQRVQDIIPSFMVDEAYRIARYPFPWLTIEPTRDGGYRAMVDGRATFHPIYLDMMRSPHELCTLFAMTQLIKDGPKIIRPTKEQAESLQNVTIDMPLTEFIQPFHTVFVEIPNNPVFLGCIVCREAPNVLILNLISPYNRDDITTTVYCENNNHVEHYLRFLDEEVSYLVEHTKAAQRIALNMCLALTNFGYNTAPDQPKQHAEDTRLAKEDTERGEKARNRIRTALTRVSFEREVIIRKPSPVSPGGVQTERRVAPHWVRGHWRQQVHGPNGSLRKRILIAPYLVHADEVVGTITTTYKDKR